MKQKKLMLHGGIRYLLPVIEAAHKLGVYVITADYLPDNIAHKYSDGCANVLISTTGRFADGGCFGSGKWYNMG